MDPEHMLERAVRGGNVTEVARILDTHGGLLNSRGSLWTAAREGQLAVVELLAGRGADLDYRSAQKDVGFGTPLLVAAGQGHPEVARWLADHGATVDVFALTALGEVDAVERLLDQDAELANTAYGTGHPTIELYPIDFAHCCGDVRMLEVLLAHGAKPAAQHVWSAIEQDSFEVADRLMGALSWQGDESMQAIFAIAARTPAAIEFLQKRGVDFNARRQGNGEHAGHFHVRKGDHESLLRVLGAGIDIDARRADGGTMLHVAVRMGLTRIVETLMDRGARHDLRDHEGTRRTKVRGPATPMDYARARKNPRMAEFLAARIADRERGA